MEGDSLIRKDVICSSVFYELVFSKRQKVLLKL